MADDNNLDPIRMMREWFVNSEKMWSDAMTEAMGDERFSNGMGRYMQEALHSQRMFSESMGQYLANINMPSRTDLLDMSDKVSQLHDKMDFVMVELRDQRKLLNALADGASNSSVKAATEATAKKKPSRTKKPAAKTEK